jgi:hypothetical protein
VLVDSARPVDYFSAMHTGSKTSLPWTFRVHDLGDWPDNIGYIRAWQMAMKARPECAFWFYSAP